MLRFSFSFSVSLSLSSSPSSSPFAPNMVRPNFFFVGEVMCDPAFAYEKLSSPSSLTSFSSSTASSSIPAPNIDLPNFFLTTGLYCLIASSIRSVFSTILSTIPPRLMMNARSSLIFIFFTFDLKTERLTVSWSTPGCSVSLPSSLPTPPPLAAAGLYSCPVTSRYFLTKSSFSHRPRKSIPFLPTIAFSRSLISPLFSPLNSSIRTMRLSSFNFSSSACCFLNLASRSAFSCFRFLAFSSASR